MALGLAKAVVPQAIKQADPNGRKGGDRVEIMPDGYGKIKVGGEIVGLYRSTSRSGGKIPRPARWWCTSRRDGFLVLPI